jgi:two-component system, cell cycle response regulator
MGLAILKSGTNRAASSKLRDARPVRVLVVAASLWLVAYAVALALTDPDHLSGKVLNDGAYLLPIVLATVASGYAARRAPGTQRRFWLVLTASNVLWLIGELTWTGYVIVSGSAPFPSVADGFYLGSYALVPLALLLAFAGSRRGRAARALLDASIAAVAIGACGYLLTIAPQLSSGFSLATATGIAYPLLGVVILVLLVGFGFSGHRQVPKSLVLVGVGFGVSAVTDAAYTYVASLHSFIPGQWLNLGWQAEAWILTLAAVTAILQSGAQATERRLQREITLPLVLAGMTGTLALVIVDAQDGKLSTATLLSGLYCVAAVIARLYLTGKDRERMARELEHALAEQERLAVTDGLTGLHNRRFFDELLTLETERATRHHSEVSLLVVDLDRFKQINDTYGHPAGDAVLVEAAARIRDTVRSSDVVARYGGEEFAVILSATGDELALATAERIRQAIASRRISAGGHSVALTASIGVASMPLRATTKEELLRFADRALYRAKRLGRNQVQFDQGDDAVSYLVPDASPVIDYLQNLADQIDARQGPSNHSVEMSVLAAKIATKLGVDRAVAERAVLAARFHDIGKVAVPDSVLMKPGSLTEEEWHIVHQHPELGARLVRLSAEIRDVAPIIAAHHEWPDGTGYPLGLSGSQIPIEARILAVCDAWTAMRSARPYRRALSVEESLQQLRRGCGTQFDPQVVRALLELDDSEREQSEADSNRAAA